MNPEVQVIPHDEVNWKRLFMEAFMDKIKNDSGTCDYSYVRMYPLPERVDWINITILRKFIDGKSVTIVAANDSATEFALANVEPKKDYNE